MHDDIGYWACQKCGGVLEWTPELGSKWWTCMGCGVVQTHGYYSDEHEFKEGDD